MTLKQKVLEVSDSCPKCRFKQKMAGRDAEDQNRRLITSGEKGEGEPTGDQLKAGKSKDLRPSDRAPMTKELAAGEGVEKKKKKRKSLSNQVELPVMADTTDEKLRENIESPRIGEDTLDGQSDLDELALEVTSKEVIPESKAGPHMEQQNNQQGETTDLDMEDSAESWVEVGTQSNLEEGIPSESIVSKQLWWKWQR